MKARSFKKFFVSIALSAVLTLSSASSVFAATAQLVPAEQSAELTQSDDSDAPAIESSDAQNACASLTAQPGIRQTAASETDEKMGFGNGNHSLRLYGIRRNVAIG